MPESVQSYFELSIHFPVFFSRELFLEQFTAGSLTDKCMKSSKHDWTLSGTATSLQFSFLFSYCQKFPIHEFFRTDVL